MLLQKDRPANFGAQVSFSGSLIENLNALEANGNANFQNWKTNWTSALSWKTTLNNPRMDLVGFGYHHPLMGLIDYSDIRRQIQEHKKMLTDEFRRKLFQRDLPSRKCLLTENDPGACGRRS
jgi:hypothetical protein